MNSIKGDSKIRIAIIQLETSISLYFKKNFICAITLAGASEEILNQFAKEKSGITANHLDKDFIDFIAEEYNKDKPSLEKVKQVNNRLKNELKHQNNSTDYCVLADLEFEAELIIDRALRNYQLYFNSFPTSPIITKYLTILWK